MVRFLKETDHRDDHRVLHPVVVDDDVSSCSCPSASSFSRRYFVVLVVVKPGIGKARQSIG